MNNGENLKVLFGKRIKELRNERKLTQENLAEILGIGQRTLSKIERGLIFVTADTLSKLTNTLNIETKELFNYEHHKTKTVLQNEVIDCLKNNEIDIEILYQMCKILKKKTK